jgi:glycosyltransferase involved in cell wall biosynthesis
MAKALAARGHSITIVLPPWQNPEDSGRRIEEDGVTIENIRLPMRIPGLQHLLIAARLARQTLRARPDVVHAFKPKAYSGLVHWLLCNVMPYWRPPIVVDTDDWEGPGGWNEQGAYTWAQKAFFAWQERWGLTHADAVTAASRTLETLVWAAGVHPGRSFYVPNGIPRQVEAVAGQQATEGGTGPVILLYTRFVEFSVARVVDLLARIVRNVPDARLLVVGGGLRSEADCLAALAEERGISHAVSLASWDSDQLPDHMARSDLAIYPLDDTLINRSKAPVKLLELLESGLAVVADRVGEAREFIRHGETGWLVRPGDADEFAEAVIKLLGARDLRARLGAAAVRDVRTRYGWGRTVETVLRAYEAAGARL